jgi:hypothetical protein
LKLHFCDGCNFVGFDMRAQLNPCRLSQRLHVDNVPLQDGKVNENERRRNAFIKGASPDKPFRILPSHHFHLPFAVVPATMVAHSVNHCR